MAGTASGNFTQVYPTTGGQNVNTQTLTPGANGTWTNLTSGASAATVEGALEDAGYIEIQIGTPGTIFRIPIVTIA